ncbi:serine hydrolase [Bernardetia sp. ABR2-2B]|uniref:serine hydrolase domain-containing protein n=1 Tax=Bernardetia sp. ABR2-2B TaxID=3127472 RepID=UPI0030D527F5
MYKIIFTFFCYFLASQISFAQLDFSKENISKNPLFSKLDSTIKAGKYEQITSVLVAHNGNLIFEKYYNDTDSNSMHNTRSATKTMASLLTGIAIKKGYINSEKDKIFKYLQHKLPTQNADKRKEEVTIEDLLTMSSVMECDDYNSFSRGNEERMYLIEDWTSFFIDLPIRAYTFEPKPENQPYGRSFRYCSAGAATMAEILERSINMKLDSFAYHNLFKPLGIKDYKLDYNPEGILNTAGGSEYRSRDFLKLIQMCLNDGKWNNQEILEKSWLEKATTPKVKVYEGLEYGYLFWLKSFGQEKMYKAFCMAGNGGQKILAIPELGVSVVITTTNYGNGNGHNYTDEIMNAFVIPVIEN